MDRNTALKIWEQYYGTKDEAYDYASHLIKKYEYQNRSSEYGWAIDYKRPLTFGGKNVPDNMIPTSLEVIRKRNGKLNFTIGNLSYEIRKGKKFGLYYIFDVTDKNAPISVEPDVDNQDPEYNKKRLLRSENKESKPTFDLSSPLKKKEYNFITSQNDKKDDEIAKLKKELEERDRDIQELNDRLFELDNKVEEKEQEGIIIPEMTRKMEVDVSGDIKELENTISSLTKEKEDKDQEIERLNKVIYQNADDQNKLKQSLRDLEGKNGELQGKLVSYESERNRYIEEKNSLKQKIESLNHSLQEKEEQIKSLNQEEGNKEASLDEYKKEIDLLTSQRDEKQQQLNAIILEKEELNKQISSLEQENHTYSENLNSLNQEKENLLNQISILESKKNEDEQNLSLISELQTKISTLNDEKNALLENEQNYKTEISDLNKKKDDLLSYLNDAQNKVNAIQKEKESIEVEIETLKQENEKIVSEQQEKLDKISQLENERNLLLTEKEEKDKKINENEEKLEELNKIISSLNSEKENINQEKDNINNQVTSLNEEKNNLLQKINELENSLTSLNEEKDNLNSKNLEYENIISDKDNLLASKDEELVKKDEEKVILSNENAELKNQLVEKENEKVNLQNELVTLQTENNSRTEEINSLISQRDEKQNALDALTIENENNKNALIKNSQDIELMVTEKNQLVLSSQKLQEENNQYKADIAGKQEAIDHLTLDYEALKESYSALSEEKNKLSDEKNELTEQVNNLNNNLLNCNESLSEKNRNIEELKQSNEEKDKDIQSKNEDIANKDRNIEELNTKLTEKDNLILDLNNKKNELENSLLDKNNEISNKDNEFNLLQENYSKLKSERERIEAEKNDTINILQEKLKDVEKENLFYSLGGRKDKYEDLKEYLNYNDLPFDKENICKIFATTLTYSYSHDELLEAPIASESNEEILPQVKDEISDIGSYDVSYIEKEIIRERNARNYFGITYGKNNTIGSDFAGREVHLDKYLDEKSPFGWNYVICDPLAGDNIDNIVVANIRTLKDFSSSDSFVTNGHTYHVEIIDGKRKVISEDFITDPYDFESSLEVIQTSSAKEENLIYLFIKCIGTSKSEPSHDALMNFFDLIDKTVKRCCPNSFIEAQLKSSGGKGSNCAFITFDGTVDGAYKEVLDYAVLLNSYRLAFREKNMINAIIVLDQVKCRSSLRHVGYDTIYAETKDPDLKAVIYELVQNSVINATIKRTLILGPEIIDDLPVDASSLTESRLGAGNFAEIYKFSGIFREYNYRFDISKNKNTTDN